jgi:hypothetical protein
MLMKIKKIKNNSWIKNLLKINNCLYKIYMKFFK